MPVLQLQYVPLPPHSTSWCIPSISASTSGYFNFVYNLSYYRRLVRSQQEENSILVEAFLIDILGRVEVAVETINEKVVFINRWTDYAYGPALVLAVLGAVVTSAGLFISIRDGITSWTLAHGLILLTLSALSLTIGRMYALIMMKLAFRHVASKVEEFNGIHRNDKIMWQLVYKSKQYDIDTLNSDSPTQRRFKPDAVGQITDHCFNVRFPTLYISIPDVISYDPSSGNDGGRGSHAPLEEDRHYDPSDPIMVHSPPKGKRNTILISHHPTSHDGVATIKMSGQGNGGSKIIYCTHCGDRSEAPSTALLAVPLCQGCRRPILLPKKYFKDYQDSSDYIDDAQ